MNNPWHTLCDEPDFLAAIDRDVIHEHNETVREEGRFHLELLPEPFIGNPDASIVILNANPGYDTHDLDWHRKPEFKKASLANLNHTRTSFFLLAPDFRDSPGGTHWRKRLRELAEAADPDHETGFRKLAPHILLIESCPYHSKHFPRPRRRIPSQGYSDSLIDNAMKKNALILTIRRAKEWGNKIKGLRMYPHRIAVNSPQCGYISSGNMDHMDWSALVEHLRQILQQHADSNTTK